MNPAVTPLLACLIIGTIASAFIAFYRYSHCPRHGFHSDYYYFYGWFVLLLALLTIIGNVYNHSSILRANFFLHIFSWIYITCLVWKNEDYYYTSGDIFLIVINWIIVIITFWAGALLYFRKKSNCEKLEQSVFYPGFEEEHSH